MAQIETWYAQDIKHPVKVRYLDGNVFSQDNQGNIIGVEVFDGDTPATLTGSVSASVVRSDGYTVAVSGTRNGNKLSVALPESAYAIPGIISIVLKLEDTVSTTTLLAVVAMVYQSSTSVIVDPGTIIPSIADLIEEIQTAISDIPQDYAIVTNSLFAVFCISELKTIVYDYDNESIVFPSGTFLFNNADTSVFGSAQTINLSQVQTTYHSWVLYVTASGSIYAVPWNNAESASINDHFIGYIYDKYVFINGVNPYYIHTVDDDGERLDLPYSQSGAFLALTYPNSGVVTFNYESKIITIPQGFYVFHGMGHGMPTGGHAIDVSNITTAGVLYIKRDGTIYVTEWNARTIETYDDEAIGYIWGYALVLNGIPQENIKIVNDSGSILGGSYPSPGIIGLAHNSGNIVYNYTTKDLTIPPAFTAYRGFGKARSASVTINVSSVLNAEACFLFVNRNCEIYAKKWNGCFAENQTDQFVGYIFRKQVVIFGVNPSQISVIDESTDKVFCFGDSITAGVGTSKLYHMFWHDYNPNLMFYNWGIGSTGYVFEYTGTAVVGGGVIGDGTSQSVNGDNCVLKVMQGINGDMPNICIFSGTNDYGNNVALADFRTAVQNTLDYALTKTSKVLVITPIKRNGWDTGTNSLGLHLKDYCDVIAEECESRGIVCMSGYDVPLNPSIEGVRTAFVPDGLHPNENGQARIARTVDTVMLEAFCR